MNEFLHHLETMVETIVYLYFSVGESNHAGIFERWCLNKSWLLLGNILHF